MVAGNLVSVVVSEGVGRFPFLRNTINNVSLSNICRLLGPETHEEVPAAC